MVPPLPYPAPLDRLLTLGLDEREAPADVDYAALGIGLGDVPALITIATDPRYAYAPAPVAWASVHAWRALGELGAADAAQPLVGLLREVEGDDWALEELPRALGLIGIPALGAIQEFLGNTAEPLWGRIAATEAITAVARNHPDSRDACVAVLAGQLERFEEQDDELNAFLVFGLTDLDAVETAPLLERVFASGRIDVSLNGDWEDVQIELGLLSERLTPRPNYHARYVSEPRAKARPSTSPTQKRRAAEKRRRKLAKQSKRRNRRRK